MLRTRKNTLAVIGGGWSHPYGRGPMSPFLYADGGDGGGGTATPGRAATAEAPAAEAATGVARVMTTSSARAARRP